MKNVIVLLFLLAGFSSFGQTEFTRGFNIGYAKGYCYQEVGCVSPPPPVVIPNINERSNSYEDGYNRGFKKGLEDKDAVKKKESSGGAGGGYRTSSPEFIDYRNIQAPGTSDVSESQRRAEIEAVSKKVSQLESFYASYTNTLDRVKDGWHNVIATNKYDFFEQRKVYVINNKVIKYLKKDIHRQISYSVPVNRAKAIIQLIDFDGTISNELLEIYFLEFMNNPNSTASSPPPSGTLNLWTNFSKGGKVFIAIDDEILGEINKLYSSAPECNSDGTFTIEISSGRHNVKALNEAGRTWDFDVSVNPNKCSQYLITK